MRSPPNLLSPYIRQGATAACCSLEVTPLYLTICPDNFFNAVWDSSIVVAKFLEHHPQLVQGKRACDLSAGCGLIGEQHQTLSTMLK